MPFGARKVENVFKGAAVELCKASAEKLARIKARCILGGVCAAPRPIGGMAVGVVILALFRVG